MQCLKVMRMSKHWECRYCDSPFGSKLIGDDAVCRNCEAEWAGAKMLVETEECEYEEDEE